MKSPEEIKRGLGCCETVTCPDKKCPYYASNIPCDVQVQKDALALIQQLEAQVPKWISVEERTPRAYETVIVFATGMDGCWYRNTAYHDGARWRGYGSRLDTVLYWMPLSEPPKEEEKCS